MKWVICFCISTIPWKFAFADSKIIDRCSWGYQQSKQHLKVESIDDLSPGSLSAREICKIAFDPGYDHEESAWVNTILQNLHIPKNELKSSFFLTAEGNCIIGSKLYQKAYMRNRDIIHIELVAKNICNKLPLTFR